MTQDPSLDNFRKRLQRQARTPQKAQPVKARSSVTEPMGSRGSKDKPPTASSSHHGSTGSSAGRELKTLDRELKTLDRELKTLERNSPVARRSSSQQPELRQHYSGDSLKYYPENIASRSEYDHGKRGAYQGSDRTASSLMSNATSRGNSKFGGTVIGTLIDSLVHRYETGAGVSATTTSSDAYYWKAQTGGHSCIISQPRGSSDAHIAPIHNSVIAFSGPSESNNSSNGRRSRTTDRSSDTRIQSASEVSSKFGGTVIDSSVSHYGNSAGRDAAASDANCWKSQTGQHDFQSQGSSNTQIAPLHTSTVTSDSNNRSNGRQSRTTDRSGTNRIRSASQGLRNLGNTCYMNSILQCLAKVPWFKDGRERHLKFKDDLLNEFFSLMKKMQENDSDDSSLDPYQFRQQISSLGFRFSSSEQNDAHEFLLCLLSRLSKTLKSEGKTDLVGDFLLGRQQNVIRFKGCKHVLINDQPFFSLSLPLTLDSGKPMFSGVTVELRQCLENYTRIEDVDGDALCMDCQRMQLCSIEASFKCPPKILIIHLKRYDFTRAEKLENEVRFPLEKLRITQKNLNASGKVEGYEDIVYDLIAVCNHYGSLRFGHYTADIKSPSSNHWYNYSDSRVTQVTKPSASREVCILFYQQSHQTY